MVSKWDEFEEVKPQNNDVWSQFEEVKTTQPDAWAQFEEVKPAKTTPKTKPIAQPNSIQASKQAEIERIKKNYEEEIKQIDKERFIGHAKNFGGAALEIGSAAIPGFGTAKITGAIAKNFVPKLGRKLAKEVASGIASGTASGAVFGAGRGLLEDKNPILTALQDAGAGALTGGGLGFAGGKVVQKLSGNKLKNYGDIDNLTETERKAYFKDAKKYYSDYLQETKLQKDGDINLSGKGIQEVLKWNPKQAQNLPELKKDIKKSNKITNEQNTKPEQKPFVDSYDVYQGENGQHLIEINKNGDRTYYFTRNNPDGTPRTASTGSNRDTNIINDSEKFFNPTEFKERGLEQSVLKSKGAPKEIKEIIKKDTPTYGVLKNENIINKAIKDVESNFTSELSRLMGADEFDALDYEKSRQIAKRLFDAGEHEAGMELIDRVSESATKKGQAIQALSLWSNMTPEGAVFKAQKLLKEYNKKNPKKQIELTPEQTETIRDLQKEALNTTDELAKKQAFARTAKYIGELVPKNAMQKLKAYRNISLLLNPKTLARNIVGNALFNTVETASKALAVPIDRAIGLFTGQKTRVLPQIGSAAKGLTEGAKVGFKEALEGIDTRGLGQRFDLNQGKVFQSKPMQALETALDIGLRVPDRAFYEATFAESVANMMKAQGLKQPTQEILEQAEKEALESVFQNKSVLSDLALGTRKNLNRIGTKDFGLGDAVIPYAQTPANIAQQGINYSPAGFGKGLYNAIAKGDQRQASLDIARGLVGSGLIGGGYAAAKSGLMTPSQYSDNPQTNKKIKENFAPLGIRPDQLGGVWYSPFQPISTSLAVGGAMARGENPLQAGINTVVDLPFLQGVSRGLRDLQEGNYAQAGANILSQIPSQFVPTLGSQIAQYIDPYQRETYAPNVWQRGLNQALAKVPFASQTLPVKRDVTGQPIERYSTDGLQRAYDIFLNPTYINKKQEDVVLDELKNIYENTGETKQFLPSVSKNINFKDENGEKQKIELTGEQVSEYQRVLGQINYNAINNLIQSSYYQNLSDSEKIKSLNSLLSDNNELVKNRLFGVPLQSQKKPNTAEQKRQRLLSKRRNIERKQYKNNFDDIFNDIYYQE